MKDVTTTVSTLNNEVKMTRNLKILIAEDDEVSALFLNTVLEMNSREILKAVNGVKAVEIFRQNPDIDLIMMDVRMPEMSGYEATRLIREISRDVVIIAQTAFGIGGEMEKVRAAKAGCNDYISKPIDVFLLKRIINKYFLKEEPLSHDAQL
jgi:CheY-like chemotaxis protein